MAKRKRGDHGSFADAVESIGDVEPLDRSKLSERPLPTHQNTRAEAHKGSEAEPRGAPAQNLGASPKTDTGNRATRTQMRRLRAGKLRPQTTIDLHGFSKSKAYSRLCNAVARAVSDGVVCVLVIHGKGKNSPEGRSVLKQALSDWIAQPPLSNSVLGCCLAQPADGGEGASYMLLRS